VEQITTWFRSFYNSARGFAETSGPQSEIVLSVLGTVDTEKDVVRGKNAGPGQPQDQQKKLKSVLRSDTGAKYSGPSESPFANKESEEIGG
jgi:hypothetical protein